MNPERAHESCSASAEVYAKLTPEQQEIAGRFEAGLAQTKPYMFHLAETIIDDYPDKHWNIIIGDDTSGRLPTRFINKALESQSIDLPVSYIMAGSKARNEVPLETYRAYVDGIRAAHDTEPLRPLIISESAGTFGTVGFVRELFRPVSEQVDIGVVGTGQIPPQFEGLYTGGVGPDALGAVFATFEKVQLEAEPPENRLRGFISRHTPERIKEARRSLVGRDGNESPEAASYQATNLDNSPQEKPVASITTDQSYRLLSNYCYHRMDELAQEFAHDRGINELEKIANQQLDASDVD